MLNVVFWSCVIVVIYTYIGYALLIYLLAKYFPYQSEQSPLIEAVQQWPALTLCIAAYNEADIIAMKMDNCLQLDYPADKLTILWVTDGSTDESNLLLNAYPQVKTIFQPERGGKTAAINHAMAVIDTDFVVFTDANCLLSIGALKLIAKQFNDTTVGCVSGEKRVAYEEEDTLSSKGEGFYWKYESLLKKWDNIYYSAVGAAGELFAIRSSLYKPLPTHILLDDFMISMQIAREGYRIAYLPEAYAVERGSLNIEEEGKRKVRIAAGGWQSVGLLSDLLNVFTYGRLSFQYISHRVLRWTITPFALFLLIPLNFVLIFTQEEHSFFYVFIFFLQVIFYVLAAIGYRKRNEEHVPKLFFVPFYFVFMNINVFEGLIYLKNKTNAAIWEKSKRKI